MGPQFVQHNSGWSLAVSPPVPHLLGASTRRSELCSSRGPPHPHCPPTTVEVTITMNFKSSQLHSLSPCWLPESLGRGISLVCSQWYFTQKASRTIHFPSSKNKLALKNNSFLISLSVSFVVSFQLPRGENRPSLLLNAIQPYWLSLFPVVCCYLHPGFFFFFLLMMASVSHSPSYVRQPHISIVLMN